MKFNSKAFKAILEIINQHEVDHLVVVTQIGLDQAMDDLQKVCSSMSILPSIEGLDFPTNQLCVIFEDISINKIILGKLKNLLAQKIILANNTMKKAELLELGFIDLGLDSEPGIFTYNLESYNKKRDWNNADGWANPENFGKYRW